MTQSIDEGVFVRIHGVDQWVTIRGKDASNPALLMIGGASFSRLALWFEPWELHFTLVQWDQPGAGSTWVKNGDAGCGPITLDRLARDGIAVAEFACRRLGVDRLILLGISLGSAIGLKMIRQRPALFSAYAANGQLVNWARQEALSYALVLERARSTGDRDAVTELEAIGPPPYGDIAQDVIKSKYSVAQTPGERAAVMALDRNVLMSMNQPPAGSRFVPEGLGLADMMERASAVYGLIRSELAGFDARALGLRFDVPMVFLDGRDDIHHVASEAQAYAAELEAPSKAVAQIEGGGASAFLMPEFLELLTRHVRPLAAASRGVDGRR
jgi:pimeloyl-ACP methyl ester carboxylesterase